MSKIRSKDSVPELRVRKLAHRLGYRFRLHRSDLPGRPDMVFPGRRKIIFVHGCFWHQHPGCKRATIPRSNVAFWRDKLKRNRRRDEVVLEKLAESGWDVLVIWECETKDDEALAEKLKRFLK